MVKKLLKKLLTDDNYMDPYWAKPIGRPKGSWEFNRKTEYGRRASFFYLVLYFCFAGVGLSFLYVFLLAKSYFLAGFFLLLSFYSLYSIYIYFSKK